MNLPLRNKVRFLTYSKENAPSHDQPEHLAIEVRGNQ